jgi:hypothetical protein
MLGSVRSIIVVGMNLPRLRRHDAKAPVSDGTSTIDARALERMFAAPKWLQDLGLLARTAAAAAEAAPEAPPVVSPTGG